MTLRAILTLSCLSAAALSGGCVERKLTITSEPAGALVFMNDKEIGRTPIETDFVYYGKYDVQVRKDGYQTLDKPTKIEAPWWQYVPIDLFAELMPWHPTDRKKLHYTLTPRLPDDRPIDDLVYRGADLGAQMESPNRPTTQATQPTTRASTQPATRPSTQK